MRADQYVAPTLWRRVLALSRPRFARVHGLLWKAGEGERRYAARGGAAYPKHSLTVSRIGLFRLDLLGPREQPGEGAVLTRQVALS